MRFNIRWLGFVPLFALVATLSWQATSSGGSAQSRYAVTILDNQAPSPLDGFDPDQAYWRFNPHQLVVPQGAQVVFQSPPGNHHPHTVTSLVRISGPFASPVVVHGGTIFESSPTQPPDVDTRIHPGESFTLGTSILSSGNYAYFCKLHPWMNGEITVD